MPEEKDIITETVLFSASFIGHEALSAWMKMDARSCEENKRCGIYLIGIYQDLLFKIAATVNDLFGLTVSFRNSQMPSHVHLQRTCWYTNCLFSEQVHILCVSGWVKLVSDILNIGCGINYLWIFVYKCLHFAKWQISIFLFGLVPSLQKQQWLTHGQHNESQQTPWQTWQRSQTAPRKNCAASQTVVCLNECQLVQIGSQCLRWD